MSHHNLKCIWLFLFTSHAQYEMKQMQRDEKQRQNIRKYRNDGTISIESKPHHYRRGASSPTYRNENQKKKNKPRSGVQREMYFRNLAENPKALQQAFVDVKLRGISNKQVAKHQRGTHGTSRFQGSKSRSDVAKESRKQKKYVRRDSRPNVVKHFEGRDKSLSNNPSSHLPSLNKIQPKPSSMAVKGDGRKLKIKDEAYHKPHPRFK